MGAWRDVSPLLSPARRGDVTNVTPSEIDIGVCLGGYFVNALRDARPTKERERESMGNRANYGFRSGHNTVFLYGHWAGEPYMAERLASALREAQPRWDDDAYATRIAISQLIGDDWNSETGWGIYVNEIGDNENPVFVVDWASRTVEIYECEGWSDVSYQEKLKQRAPSFRLTFDEFMPRVVAAHA